MSTGSMTPTARRVRYMLDEAGKQIPTPTPALPAEQKIHLLEINPAGKLYSRTSPAGIPTHII